MAGVKKNRKRKKKSHSKHNIAVKEKTEFAETEQGVDLVQQDESDAITDDASTVLSREEKTKPVVVDAMTQHTLESIRILPKTHLVVQTSFLDDSSVQCVTDNASMSSLSMSLISQISPNSVKDSEQTIVTEKSDSLCNDELSDITLSSSSSFIECTTKLPQPLSYARYPFFEEATLKLATAIHENGYQGFVFGGAVYRQYSLPNDIDMVIPDFMSTCVLQTLQTSSPDPTFLERVKRILDDLEARGITAIGFNPYLKIPGYQRENRYMLPLCITLENRMVINADLTFFSGSIEAHAQRDLSFSALYYDPIQQKMYSHASFRALEDLTLRLIRPVSEPIGLIHGSPKLIFNFIKLHIKEAMQFDTSLLSALLVIGQQYPNVFGRLSDIILHTEFKQLDECLDRPRQFSLFWQLGLFPPLYHRLLSAQSEKLVPYLNDMQTWLDAGRIYQQQLYAMAVGQQFTFYGATQKRTGSSQKCCKNGYRSHRQQRTGSIQEGEDSAAAKQTQISSSSPNMR